MAKKKIYICASAHFPHGDAGANRIQYIAQGLQLASYDVFVLSTGQTPKTAVAKDGWFSYAGLPYRNLELANAKKEKLLSGYLMVSLLKKCGVTQNDIVYLYGSNSLYISPILSFCRRKKIKTVIDVVEWHQPFQYPKGEQDIRYRSSNKTFTKLSPKTNGIVSISECICDYYTKQGCYTKVFPVIIDAKNIPFDMAKKSQDDKIHLIYPGNPMYKDDIGVMLEGLALLSQEEQSKIVMHLTGVKEEKLRAFLGEGQTVFDRLGETVCFHGWMEYEDLIALYQSVDFLYMSRPDNLVTRANFPSKLPELMAYAVAPVGNRVGDYYEYLTDGVDSVLFNQNTPEDCRDAIRRVLSMTKEERNQLCQNARTTVCEKFDYRKWDQKLNEFVENLI
ncbi:MAG: glycosyltransferase [Clostridia bacterium]|nr:glycosyltransferase [Clostridia bacterium]